MLTGAITLYAGSKLVISTISGKLFAYSLKKDADPKKVSSTLSTSEQVYTMEKLTSKKDNFFMVGGNGVVEIISLVKNGLVGIHSFSKISRTVI
jgi:hypothetical protein